MLPLFVHALLEVSVGQLELGSFAQPGTWHLQHHFNAADLGTVGKKPAPDNFKAAMASITGATGTGQNVGCWENPMENPMDFLGIAQGNVSTSTPNVSSSDSSGKQRFILPSCDIYVGHVQAFVHVIYIYIYIYVIYIYMSYIYIYIWGVYIYIYIVLVCRRVFAFN